MGKPVEFDTRPGQRLRVSRDNGRLELRLLSLLSASSGIYSPTRDGLSVPVEVIPGLIVALRQLGGAA